MDETGNRESATSRAAGDSGQLISVGSVNADFQLRVDREPGLTETLLGRELTRLSGGKAANVAVFARRFGLAATLVGRVGGDELAEQALAPLRDEGIALEAVVRAAGAQTGVAMIVVPPSGKKRIVLATNANDGWTDAERGAALAAIEAAAQRASRSVLVVDHEIDACFASDAIALGRRLGLAVVVDPSFPDRVRPADLKGLAAITPNEEEARALVAALGGHATQVEALALALSRAGPEAVCVKRGDGGCVLAHQGRLQLVPALAVEVVDTTGAGDAFTAAFAVGLLEGRSALECATLAVAAAQCAVGAWGSQPGYPARAVVEALRERVAAGVRSCDG